MTKWVYRFGDGAAEGCADRKNLLGGKGAGLAEMSHLGLPVPPGFTITTEACSYFYAHGKSFPAELQEQVECALAGIERSLGARFGDPDNPLLVSVRSGARVSMPGMMDTVLNLGLNDRVVEGLACKSGDERFAYDSYRRFIQMYGQVVLGIENHFEELLENHKLDSGVLLDTDLSADDWRTIVAGFKDLVAEELGRPFPEEPQEQLWGAIGAVFGSWMNPRAVIYRRLHDIPGDWGTAVNIQAMVFGNMGADCATGVAFTRNPSTGANEFYGEYLVNAQGEDVVAGIRTPQHLTIASKEANKSALPAMEEVMPEVLTQLYEVRRTLENHYRDMQDVEFTVQRGKLWMLQTRSGKRTAQAALKIAVSLVDEGLIVREEAIGRIDPASLDQLLHPTLDPKAKTTVLARGLPASPGAASGEIVFTAEEAESRASRGEAVILVRIETSPEDIHGMHAAKGILTTRGGMTSHAAVVARGMGRPCVTGAGDLRVDYAARTMVSRNIVVMAGETITIDGSTGEVMLGAVPTIQPELSGDFATLMGWADGIRRMKVRANAETAVDARMARRFGAEGIGLSRTEQLTGKDIATIRHRAIVLHEVNPMLGHRGCRLGITYPEIYEMQAAAIFEAAVVVTKETGEAVEPEIMVPLVATRKEFDILKVIIDRVGREVMERAGITVRYLVGTMIELPRAALRAGEIAETAEFFSFGTNDLTQTVFGLSRDDAASFAGAYQRLGIFEHDPFVTLDVDGVGELVRLAVDRGRAARPGLKLGICGEHGGDPMSIGFCQAIGLDYVSCSPYRIPIARLAAAQAVLAGDPGDTTV